MAQGFKDKLERKTRSTASQNKGKGVTKKGARVIAPKKAATVAVESKKKAASGSHGAHFEELAASKAASKGKLSAIMKPVAAKGDSMSAEKKAKGR